MIRLGLFAAGVRLAQWLPAPLLYRAAYAVAWILASVPSPPRRRLRRNLAHVLGVAPHSRRLRPYVRRVYLTHAANYVDLLRGRHGAPRDVAHSFVREGGGWEALLQAWETKRGAVLVTAHFGRIERLSHLFGHLGLSLTLLVERLEPPALFDLLCRLRARPNFHLVPHDAALRPCLRALARGDLVVAFADWDPSGHGTPVRFFDAPARLPGGPAFLARRAGVPLFVGFSLPTTEPDRYRAILEPPLAMPMTADPEADVQRATQWVAQAFERYIRRYPDQWVMFHEMWPPGGADGMVECPANEPAPAAPPAAPHG